MTYWVGSISHRTGPKLEVPAVQSRTASDWSVVYSAARAGARDSLRSSSPGCGFGCRRAVRWLVCGTCGCRERGVARSWKMSGRLQWPTGSKNRRAARTAARSTSAYTLPGLRPVHGWETSRSAGSLFSLCCYDRGTQYETRHPRDACQSIRRVRIHQGEDAVRKPPSLRLRRSRRVSAGPPPRFGSARRIYVLNCRGSEAEVLPGSRAGMD